MDARSAPWEHSRPPPRRVPDDILVWGYLADADIALGDYDDAEKSAQWMLDLRPGNIPGLLLGACLTISSSGDILLMLISPWATMMMRRNRPNGCSICALGTFPASSLVRA